MAGLIDRVVPAIHIPPAYATWLPILALPLFWLLAGAWFHADWFHSSRALRNPWLLWAMGSGGYLLALAGIVVWGNRRHPLDVHSRVVVALSTGCAFAFLTYVFTTVGHDSLPAIAAPNDPLSPLNAVSAVLAVVLAVVTLIATKSASDARAEAEQARSEILDALNIRLLASVGLLLEYQFRMRAETEELVQQANDISNADENLARYFSLAASVLSRLSKLLGAIHLGVLASESETDEELAGLVHLLQLDMAALDRAVSLMASPLRAMEQRLRREYWQPVSRLIDQVLDHDKRKAGHEGGLSAKRRLAIGKINTLLKGA